MQRFFGFLIWLVYRLWVATWRIRFIEPDLLKSYLKNRQAVIFAHWHGDELVLVSTVRRYRVATMASTSKDGEMMNTVIRLLGGKTSRGSSTRGAVSALKGLMRLLKSGYNASMAVDGPKGPVYEVKPGVFEISRVAKLPIFVSGVAYSNAIHFPKSWNKTYLPKPFTKITVNWEGPIMTLSNDQDPRDPELAQKLAKALNEARDKAQILHHPNS